MNIVLCNIDPSLKNIIISRLTQFKLNLFLVDDDAKLFGILDKKKIDCLFYDIDVFESDVIKTLDSIKNNQDFKDVKIIALTANRSGDLMNTLFSMELAGVLSKNTNYHDFIENLKKIILYLEKEVTVRSRRWIIPTKADHLKIRFSLSNDQNISMKVLKLSVDGLVIKIPDETALAFLKSNPEIKDVTLFINKKMFYIDVKVIKMNEKRCAVRFANKTDVFLLEISSFIYDLLSRSRE